MSRQAKDGRLPSPLLRIYEINPGVLGTLFIFLTIADEQRQLRRVLFVVHLAEAQRGFAKMADAGFPKIAPPTQPGALFYLRYRSGVCCEKTFIINRLQNDCQL